LGTLAFGLLAFGLLASLTRRGRLAGGCAHEKDCATKVGGLDPFETHPLVELVGAGVGTGNDQMDTRRAGFACRFHEGLDQATSVPGPLVWGK
jgi:hypothetical protein